MIIAACIPFPSAISQPRFLLYSFLPSFPSNRQDKGSHPYRAVSSNHLRAHTIPLRVALFFFFSSKHHHRRRHHHHHHHHHPHSSTEESPPFLSLSRHTTLVITVIKQCCNRYNKGYSFSLSLLLSRC